MNSTIKVAIIFILTCFTKALCSAEVDFPVTLTRNNFELRFEVDSTWHVVKGIADVVSGEVSLINTKDPTSLQITAIFPVRSLNTDHESRDIKLRQVMHEDKNPHVKVSLKNNATECNVQKLAIGQRCSLALSGVLEISGTQRSISLPAEVLRALEDTLTITGSFAFEWPDYGVDDPSIFIATLDPHVVITFVSKVPYGKHS